MPRNVPRVKIDVGFPTGYERRLPPAALVVLRDRRRRLLGRPTGRVLDLGGCEAHVPLLSSSAATSIVVLTTPEERGARLRRRAADAPIEVDVRDATIDELADAGERFDTVVSVLQLSLDDDLEAGMRTIGRLISPDGVLLFLEPTTERGLTARVQHLLGPATRLTTGRRPDRDLTGSARAGGLLVTDCERLTMPTLWPFRAFVEGVARLPIAARAR
jgi:SAM-dependent methyltransferase